MTFSSAKFMWVLLVIMVVLLPARYGQAADMAYQTVPAPIYLASRRGVASLDDAVRRVLNRTGGRVLKAWRRGNVFVIKVLMPSGVVRKFRIKAN